MQTYLVGGAVRDKLLDLPVKDRDWVVVGSSVEEMIDLGFKSVGADFPVFLHPESHEEYALARTERKVAAGYHGFTFHASPEVTLEQDLQRRDLTINAIAEDENGNLIDPWDGIADIRSRTLRHVSPAFAEDPVRILRVARLAARFSSLDFQVADDTSDLMKSMVANGEVDSLVPERVWQELDKSLAHTNVRVFFETLRDCDALSRIMPELDRLFGIPQPEKWHPEIDTGLHTMMCLDQIARLTDDRAARFALICHDFGKAETPEAQLPSHPGHEDISAALAETFCERLRVPRDYRDLAVLVARYHTHVHRALELNERTLATTLGAVDVARKPERFEHFLLACEADARGRLGLENRQYPQADYLRGAASAFLKVDAGAIARSAPDPSQIRQRVHQARVGAMAEYIREHRS